MPPPPCHLTRLYRLTYYPDPLPWVFGLSPCAGGSGRGVVGRAGLPSPSPPVFVLLRFHFHPSNISGVGEPGWGEVWEGSRVRFWGPLLVVAFGPRVKLAGVCDVPAAAAPPIHPRTGAPGKGRPWSPPGLASEGKTQP